MQAREAIEQAAMTLPLAIAVAGLLAQHLRNLFGNGIRFTDGAALEL
jgi:hypothetical protein